MAERVRPLGEGSTRGETASAWLIGIAALAIGVVIALRLMIPNDMDPTVFLALGEESQAQTEYAGRLLGEVATRRELGHDGRFFFPQANDPWYLEPEVHAVVLDRPIYRAQRMLFPVLAGGFGLFPPSVVVWSMLVTNLVGLTIGAILAAKLAQAWGAPTLLGLWVPLNVGLLFELDIGGAGIVAYTCCLGATYAFVKERTWLASALFAAAALSKEYMVAFAIGVFILVWLEERRRLWRLVVVPAIALGVWGAYIWVRLDGIRGVGGGTRIFGLPLVGLLEAVRVWLSEPLTLIVSVTLFVIVIVFAVMALRSRLLLAWGALPVAGMVFVLSANVLAEPFNSARIFAPILTAFPFLVMMREEREGLGVGRSIEGPR
jgi:hypothetical protein